jgi:hypothetical protein
MPADDESCTGRRDVALLRLGIRGEVGRMRPVVTIVLAATLALGLHPALAQQSPGAATMPPGTQNPALAQPQMASPLIPGTRTNAAQPSGTPPSPGAAPGTAAPSADTTPTGAAGLCQCLISQGPNVPPLDQTKLHLSCSASVGACQAACNTDKSFAFIPEAAFSCPGQPQEQNGHIVMNFTPVTRLLSRR